MRGDRGSSEEQQQRNGKGCDGRKEENGCAKSNMTKTMMTLVELTATAAASTTRASTMRMRRKVVAEGRKYN